MIHFESGIMCQVLAQKLFNEKKLYPLMGYVYEMGELKFFFVNDDFMVDYVPRKAVRVFDQKSLPVEYDGQLPKQRDKPFHFNFEQPAGLEPGAVNTDSGSGLVASSELSAEEAIGVTSSAPSPLTAPKSTRRGSSSF